MIAGPGPRIDPDFLGAEAREDVTGYVQTLAVHAPFFSETLHAAARAGEEQGEVSMSNTRRLGNTGWSVSAIGLGGMPMSIRKRPSAEVAVQTIHAALDGGIDFIDTADVYCLDENDIGHNERLIARALAERGSSQRVYVATKGGLARPGGAWTVSAHPDHLVAACEASLEALRTDCIDLYHLHAPDPEVPFADSVGALARLREAGKVAHVGLSNVSVEEIEAARAIVPITSVQNRCNPWDLRAWSDGVVPYCEQHDITFLAYSPVGGGRRHRRVLTAAPLLSVAERHGASPYQVALAWLSMSSPVLIPIPGASKPASATSSAGALSLRLTSSDQAFLQRAYGER